MTVTNAVDWRAPRVEGIEITFPSGNVAAIRPIDAEFMILSRTIPDLLMPAVLDLVEGRTNRLNMPVLQKVEERQEFLTFLDELTKFAFVSPEVKDDPQGDNQISLQDITYADKAFLWAFFGQPAAVLRRFRQKQAEPLETVATEPADGLPAQSGDEHSGVGKPRTRTA